MEINVIYATTPNGVIGVFNNQKYDQPFHSKKDFTWFKSLTENSIVIMGYNTFQAIGKELPNRHNIVLTRFFKPLAITGLQDSKITTASSIAEALSLAGKLNKDKQIPMPVYFIGGANVLEQVYSFATNVYVTVYDQYAKESEENIYFNTSDRMDLRLISATPFKDTDSKTGKELTGEFQHYRSIYPIRLYKPI